MQATGLSDYVTSSKIAFQNAGRIPTIKPQDNKHLKYRSELKNFDQNDERVIRDFDTREKQIKDLDTGMSPFMKN